MTLGGYGPRTSWCVLSREAGREQLTLAGRHGRIVPPAPQAETAPSPARHEQSGLRSVGHPVPRSREVGRGRRLEHQIPAQHRMTQFQTRGVQGLALHAERAAPAI